MALFVLVLVVASAIDILAILALRRLELGPTARIAVALLPLPGNIALIAMVLRGIRKLDEFQQRIHFEAVVVAFLATGVAVFVYGYLQKAGAVGPLNTALIWAFMSFAYCIGYLIAASHYK
ncbi:MAG TPA: hypothetical protein VFZ57_11190 [Thermoanaerobaculia bacterium]|nr:hypothetical protein [Thermoanaerobaculia bacterium]